MYFSLCLWGLFYHIHHIHKDEHNCTRKICLTVQVSFLNSVFVGPKICTKGKDGTISKAQNRNTIINTYGGGETT